MKPAPDFNLPDQDGQAHKLSDNRGRWVVLYFYPRDDTPGCTTEACSFRDQYDWLQQQGITLLGVSKDSVASHRKFADKYNLHFPLLSDPEHKVIEAYGAWGRKKMMGREFDGTIRQTFIIDPSGQIVKTYPKVTPKDHAVQIRNDIQALATN